MTLIGIATYGDHAEFITDTVSYTLHAERLGVTTKHLPLHHLDAAVLSSGDTSFGVYAKLSALELSTWCQTFDDLAERYQATVRQVCAETPGKPEHCTAFLVGYSHKAREYVIHVYAQEQDFKPLTVKTWLSPTPWNLRPSGIELRRGRDAARAEGEPRWGDWVKTVEPLWPRRPKMKPPASVEEWVSLAETVQEHRTVDAYWVVMVMGSLVHTRLERGATTSRTVHEFAQTGEGFARLLEGTRHPIGQMQDCHCGSGKTYRDCHLRPHWTDPCGCASGRTFYECCMVPAAVNTALT